ncbi:MAG: fused MFS/spermidine synthase [Deltaproteobacteria bacterium]|nr:fused MFS/spermidine synthase [Deltaproteobacteria bacterium]
MTDTKTEPRLLLISILLFLSGAAGLVYEVIWTRILHYSFGSTEMAAATVLATFMGGLALGGALGGRFASKLRYPILVYGILELVIALYGILFTPLLYRMDFIYSITGSDGAPWLLTTLRFTSGMIIMLIPTVAMGATLPVLVQGVVRKNEAGKGIALLYFINTLGAVAGTFGAGFAIIPRYGLDKGIYIAVGTGIVVFAFAVIMQWKLFKPSEVTSETTTGKSSLKTRLTPFALRHGVYFALGIAFFSGLISLSNEVLWFRLLGIILDGTVYGFSALLGSFLAGLALGSLWISTRLDKHKDPWSLFVKLQLGAALGSVFTILVIPLIPFLVSGYISGTPKTPGSVFFLKVILVFFTILVPTFFYGASFPVLVRLASVQGKLSRAAGNIYSLNTIGCILGSALTGMILIPWLKNINMLLMIMVFMSVIVAFAAIFLAGGADTEKAAMRKIKLFAFVAVSVLGIVILNPNVKVVRLVNSRYSIEDYQHSIGSSVKSLYGDDTDRKNLVFEAEGAVTVVTVHKHKDGGYRLRNNGLNESYHADTEPFYAEEILYLGALPYLLHPNPSKALLIGLGGGGTLDVLSQLELKNVEVAELEPEVVKASRIMFGKRTHPVDRQNVKLRLDDGRNALLRHAVANPHTYDLVISQPSHPWLTGASNLYTIEHFRIVRKNLKPGGIFCQWVNLFRMNETGFRSLLAAFTGVFEDGHIFQVDENSVFLIGSNKKLPVNTDVISKHFTEKYLKHTIKHYQSGLNRVLKMYRIDYETARKLAKGARINSDHTPVIETVLPWVGHNSMFNVTKWLQKLDIPYYLEPRTVSLKGNSKEVFRQYMNYLGSDLDIHSQEPSALKSKLERINRTLKRWEKFLGDDFYRIKADIHQRIQDFSTSAMLLAKIKEPEVKDHRLRASNLFLAGKYSTAAFLYAVILSMDNPGFFTRALFNKLSMGFFKIGNVTKSTYANGDLREFTRIIEKLSIPFLTDPLITTLKMDPLYLERRNANLFEMSLRKSFRNNSVINGDEVTAYLDEGGEDRSLLKKIIYNYVRNRDTKNADSTMVIYRNSSSLSPVNFELAKKLRKIGSGNQAIYLFKKVLEDTDHGIDKSDILNELLGVMMETSEMKGFSKLFLMYKKYGTSQEHRKVQEGILNRFDQFNRQLIEKGIDPKALPKK